MKNKRRHHYIPQVYSKGFCISESEPLVYVYEKGKSAVPYKTSPLNLGLEKDYYSFDKDNGTDSNTIEEMFSHSENDWPRLLKLFENRIEPCLEDIDNLCTFLSLMRVRVPNFRLQMQDNEAERVRTTGMVMARHHKEFIEMHNAKVSKAMAAGDNKTAATLEKLRLELMEGKMDVAVNPQQSLIRLGLFQDMHDIMLDLNWTVFTNEFDEAFITSDNPVVWFDGLDIRKPIEEFVPYRGGLKNPDIHLIFPVTKKHILVGTYFWEEKFMYGGLRRKSTVKQFNRFLTVAAERYVYAGQSHLNNLVQRYKDVVPRTAHYRIPSEKRGYTHIIQPTVGKPHNLLKWKE